MPDLSVFDLQSVSRRRFIKGTAMAGGAFALAPYISKLTAFAAPPVADNEGILITIFLSGGNDGMNMVVPSGDPAYATLRPTLKITDGLPVGDGLSLHPSLTALKARFDQGKVAIVRGVGYQPPDLSHFSSTDIWTHGWGGGGLPTTGWLGRYLDGLPNTANESLYGVGLHGGVNAHLAGVVSQASSLPLHINDAFGIDRSDASDARMYDALIAMGNGGSGLGSLGDLYDNNEMQFMQLAQRIGPAYDFDSQDTDIAQQLVLAAHLINANLGVRVFDAGLDGFDTHSDQLDWHATLLGRLDTAIELFYAALDPRWRGQVTLMTFSEFGRRPEEDGDAGTDHGTASPLFVIGDHVKGGHHGEKPSLIALDNNDNLVPTVDFRSVYSDVLRTWLKADDTALLGQNYGALALFTAGPAAPFTGPEQGYWLASPSGGVRGYGRGITFGTAAHATHPIVAGAATPSRAGLFLVSSTGGVFCFGDAISRGVVRKRLANPIVGMAATPSGQGYWLVNAAGGVFAFGDARPHGSVHRHLSQPVVGIAATPTGKGYWLVNAAGGVLCFGDAKPHGSAAGRRLAKPVVDVCASPSGNGYWMVTAGGGVLNYGDARHYGNKRAAGAPVVTIARTPSGNGYWLASKDGAVGAFGDAPALGAIKAPTAVLVRC